MQSEHPHPGQIWKSLGMWVRVLDVSRDVVTFQGRSGRGGVTRDSLSMFLFLFRRASG
jgi:hypothetical protein